MKKLLLNSLTTAVLFSLVVFMSCGDDDIRMPDESDEVKQFNLLSGSWTLSSVTADSQPVEGWEGFTVTVTGTVADNMVTNATYTTGGNRPEGTTQVWPSGTNSWAFAANDVSTIIRQPDNVRMDVLVNADGTQATLEFEIVDNSGRTDVVEGEWTFVFTK